MAIDIERLLRLASDYHNFCSDSPVAALNTNSDELSEHELDLVAAAASQPAADRTEPASK